MAHAHARTNCREKSADVEKNDVVANSVAILAPFAGLENDVVD